jgi:serine/threonine protein kinase
MAPDQISGAGVEPATDLYALAETLYELLTGRRPYAGTALGIMRDKLKGTRQRWSCRRRCRPRASCARCWRPAWPRCPSERPSLADFVLALRSLGEEHGLPLCEPAAAVARTPHAPRRGRHVLAGADRPQHHAVRELAGGQ